MISRDHRDYLGKDPSPPVARAGFGSIGIALAVVVYLVLFALMVDHGVDPLPPLFVGLTGFVAWLLMRRINGPSGH
jgi:hypothetical protein